MKIGVDTEVSKNGKIIQTISSDLYNLETNLMRTIFDTRELQIREALIKLGWKPPLDE